MIEAMKQALNALEKVKRRAVVMGSTGDYREGQLDALKEVSEDVKPAIASLQQAIAQLESQEPVGMFAKFTDGIWREVTDYSAGVPLYTHPPQRTWQGLTDEKIKTICLENGWDSSWQSLRFAQAIEAKLKQNNGFTEENT